MRARFGLGLVVVCCAAAVEARAAVRSISEIPLGFEGQNGEFVAQTQGASVAVGRGGMAVTSKNGTVQIRFEGRNPKRRVLWDAAGDAGTKNRFIGSDANQWKSGIPLYERVTARDLYPGIDAIFYGAGGTLEYDFVVMPGGDAGRIRLRVDGADRLRVNASGDLEISGHGGGLVTQKRVVAYQEIAGVRRGVAARFVVEADGRVRFAVGKYDHTAPLILDPVLFYSSYLGNSTTEAEALNVDVNGNFYVAGSTINSSGIQNVLLFKIPPSGAPTLSVFGGTLGADVAHAVTTDSSGNVYIAGSTTSSNYPISSTIVLQSTVFGVQKAFLTALSPSNSSILFSAYFGGSGSDTAWALAMGPNDYLYIAGDTNSPDFLTYSEGAAIGSTAFQYANHGGYDGFLVSVSTSGLFNYATYIGGSLDDHVFGVAVDANSYAYVTGTTQSTDFPSGAGSGSYVLQTVLAGTANAFALKMQPGGQLASWSTYLGGNSADAGNGITLDSSANLYIAGTTGSTNFPVTSGAYQTSYQGGASDGFVTEIANDGKLMWSSYLGSAGADTLNGMSLDTGTNVVVIGSTDNTGFPVTSDAVQKANAGGQDAIVAKLNPTGASLVFSTYLGGSGNDIGTAVGVDTANNTYLVGTTASSNNDFPVTSNTYQSKYGGGNTNAFFSILSASVPTIASGGVGNAASYSTSAISPGSAIVIFGSDFTGTTASAPSVPLPVSLGGVTVTVNGTAIPLFYVSAGQINAQLPYATATGTATMTVTGPGGTSASYSLQVNTAGPGIFVIGSQAAAINADGTVNSTSNGAKAGSYISVYLTGEGPVSPAVATGAAAPTSPLSNATEPYSATIGGQTVTVYFLGLAPGFAGLGQANLQVPNLAAGNYPVILTVNGVASAAATITIAD